MTPCKMLKNIEEHVFNFEVVDVQVRMKASRLEFLVQANVAIAKDVVGPWFRERKNVERK